MELRLDDLLGLANSRFDPASFAAKKFPVQLSNKVDIFQNVAALVEVSVPEYGVRIFVDAILSVRQDLHHGKIVQVRVSASGYEFDVAKMSLPEKVDGRQKLVRSLKHYTAYDLLRVAEKIILFCEVIEQVRAKVFVAGAGWPAYMPAADGDPLSLKDLDQRMSAYARR
jgi:hypothetical protein